MTANKDLISILMPVKNAAFFLKDCLDSIVNQSYTNWELIAVNDQSTDNSKEILMDYAKLYTNMRIVNNKGKGIIDALKLAFSLSKGTYITRMDADDIMPQDKLKLMFNAIAQNPNSLITGLVKYFSANPLGNGYQKYESWLNQLCLNNNHYSQIYKECVIPSACWLVSRSNLLKCNAFYSPYYPEDYDLCFRFYKHSISLVSVNKILHHWRDHPGRASRNDINYSDATFLDIKLKYFLELDYNKSKKLQLWSAGKKGKKAALFFIENNIEFDWISNNPKKIGHDIYGKIIIDYKILKTSCKKLQAIVLVANPEAQVQIKKEMEEYDHVELFWFC